MVYRVLVVIAFAACSQQQAPSSVRAATAGVPPATTEVKCAEAARLRAQGYEALNALKLSQAKKAYQRSLELDPENRGAKYQLEIIDALASDKQVGTAAENDSLYSGSQLSACQKLEAAKHSPTKAKGEPEAVQNGQIVAYAKGDAQERDMLSLTELRTVTQRAMSGVLGCYKQALADNPLLHGDLTAKLLVEADGRVSFVTLESNSVEEATVERCIETAFSRLTFPKRQSKVALNVLVPVTLQTADAIDHTARK